MTVLTTLSSRFTSVCRAAADAVGAEAPLRARVQPVLGVVTGLGWGVLAVAVGAWVVGWQLGWVEMSMLATGALVLFVLCLVLTLGRTRLDVAVELSPLRVRVGDPATGRAVAHNSARGALLPMLLELPVGADTARFTLPLLRPRGSHEEVFVIPTTRRGVIAVGPARTVRGDPLGIARRADVRTELLELFVHPVTVPLEPLGTGLLRDLEGQTTTDVSMSDLAFHALREYQPGDDRRYIHWRSTAKAGRFLVRQFLDTRRSHLTVMIDSLPGNYTEPADFELAVSAAASIARRVLLDEQQLTILAGDHALSGAVGPHALDLFARAEPSGQTLRDLAAQAAQLAPDTSTAVVVTGPLTTYDELRRCAEFFPPEARVVVLQVDPESATGVRTGALPILTVQSLAELPALLAGATL